MISRMGHFLVNGLLIALAVIVWPVWLMGRSLLRISEAVQAEPREADTSAANWAAYTGLAVMVAFLTVVFTIALEPLLPGQGRAWVALALSAGIAMVLLLTGRRSNA